MLPPITIFIITYNRPNPIRHTINALMENLHYEGELRWLICDDSSGGTYLDDLHDDYPHFQLSSTTHNRGWGANFNWHYLTMLSTDLAFMIEDDYVLQKPLDITPGAALLTLNTNIGKVRYDGLAGHTNLIASVQEHNISALVTDVKQGNLYTGRYQYWEISPYSGHAFICSNRPNLFHRRFYSEYGLYLEGYKLGDTELEFTMRVKDMMKTESKPRIVAPLDWTTNHFEDIGQSYQHSEHDKGMHLEALS
jgi:glycosyltransferase involved in cell wall biosynthesis